MKNISILFFSIVLLALSSCYRTVDKMDNTSNNVVLSYPAAKNYNVAASGINYWNRGLLNLDLSKASADVSVSINIAQPLAQDLPITLGIDQAAVDTYNKDTLFGPTQYTLMPASYYQLPDPIKLLAGTTDTTINIKFYPSKFDISATGYLLPVTINAASGLGISNMKTIYFHIEKDPFPPYGRTNWTVVDFSSQEANGEGANNGHVIHAFDNSTSTFWHSKWQGGNDPLPYWFTIDMHTSNIVHGILILDRQGSGSNGRPKNMKLEVSNDLTTWVLAGNFTGADQNASWQKFSFSTPTVAARYFRLTISSVYGDVSYSNMAELKIF